MPAVRTTLLSLLLSAAMFTPAGAAAPPSADSFDRRAILRQSAMYQLEFRQGNMDGIHAHVALLEKATTAVTGDAELWYAAGIAYFAQAAQIGLASGNAADASGPYQKGTAAVHRALELDPDHPEALALQAGTRLMMANFARKPEVVAQLQRTAVAEMNRAVAIDPASTRARLQRAFSGLVLPAALRNHTAEAEDLDFLISEAGRSRSGDYMKIMRADLDFELGRHKEAQELYVKVERYSTKAAADVARSRLGALERGVVPLDDIKALRAAAGAQCVMCHGK